MAKIKKRERLGADGKKYLTYDIRYLDRSKLSASGKPTHRQESFRRQKDAVARLLEIQNEIADGTHVAVGGSVTVAQACDQFMRQAEDRMKDGRIGRARYTSLKQAFDCSIVPLLGGVKLAELTPANVETCYQKMLRTGSLEPTTAKRRISELKLVTDFANKRGWIKTKPVQQALKELRGIAYKPVRTFRAEDVGRLLAAVDRRLPNFTHRGHHLLKTFVNVAAFCGLRWGEIAGLTVQCVDFQQRVIRVRHNMTRWNELKAPKTRAGNRDVPMPAHVVALLREWVERFYVDNERGILFTGSKSGQCFLAKNFHEIHWYPLLRRAGLFQDGNQFHFHALRHFAASWMIEHGLPITEVASLLGHSKFDTTLQIYAHPVVGGHRQHAAFERMSRALIEAPVVIEADEPKVSFAPELRTPLQVPEIIHI